MSLESDIRQKRIMFGDSDKNYKVAEIFHHGKPTEPERPMSDTLAKCTQVIIVGGV